MLKKLLILGVFCLGFINFSFGYFYPTIKINLPGYFVNGNIYNNITSNLDFKNEDGYYISINDGGNKYTIFWNQGELYNYGYYSYFNNYNQGRFKRFCSTEGTGYCTSNYTTGTAIEFYDLENVNFTEMTISLQSETDDPGLCFYNQNNNKNYCTQVYDNNNNIILSGTLNIPNNTIDFSQRTENSNFGNGTGSITINTTCPTVGQLLKYYDSSLYNTGICYSPSIIYTGGSFEQVTPSSIFELFTDLNEYKNYLQLYGSYCNSVSNLCSQAFSGKELQYLYIANLNSELRSSEKQVYQYCNLSLNYDPDISSCVGSGVIQGGNQVSNEDFLQGILNGNYDTVLPVTGLSNGDTTVFNQFDYNSQFSGDIISGISQLFVKFTSLFSQQTGNTIPLLPSFILLPLLGIILFKLFKK